MPRRSYIDMRRRSFNGRAINANQTRPTTGEAHQFLLAEYQLVRDIRAKTMDLVEDRIKFVTTLQAAEIAFIGILLARTSIKGLFLCLIILALGSPTLLFAHIVYLRALDFQIMGRRYLRALNAIRGYFVTSCPEIESAIRMPCDPKMPRMDSVGEGSSMFLSFATTMLIITALQLVSVVSAVAWLVVRSLSPWSIAEANLTAISVGILAGIGFIAYQWRQIKRRLEKAEQRG